MTCIQLGLGIAGGAATVKLCPPHMTSQRKKRKAHYAPVRTVQLEGKEGEFDGIIRKIKICYRVSCLKASFPSGPQKVHVTVVLDSLWNIPQQTTRSLSYDKSYGIRLHQNEFIFMAVILAIRLFLSSPGSPVLPDRLHQIRHPFTATRSPFLTVYTL